MSVSLESKWRTFSGALVILVVASVVYWSAFKIQFLDGWWYLEWAAKYPFVRYLIQFLDPINITQGYRPVQGLYMYLLYHLFAFNPDGYHLAHNLLHAANAVLLFLLVWKLAKRWRLGLMAGLIYVVLPNYSLAVFWHAVVDPLTAFFYLLTPLLWLRFIEKRTWYNYLFAFGAYLFALFSKEVAIFLPLELFLIEWWFLGVKPNLRVHVRRYLPFILVWIPYLYQVIQVQSHGEFTNQFGFRIGPHMLGNLLPYMAVLAFPWINELPGHPIYYFWLAVALVAYVAIMVRFRSKPLLFLGVVALLNIAPLLGFPLDYFNTRYLYLSTFTSAILLALMAEIIWQFIRNRTASSLLTAAAVVLIVVVSSARVSSAASDLAEYTRQLRVPFRDIVREHPTFPDDSYLYFIYSSQTPLEDLRGLFMTRYGLNLPVSGTEEFKPARLRDHAHTFVYYFDDQNRPRELVVNRNAQVSASLSLPADFNVPVRLDGYEVVNPALHAGDPLFLLLYWKATGSIGKDYTVFVHLLDARAQVAAACDSQPRKGNAPTTGWKLMLPVVDGIVCSIPADLPAGVYQLELGLYDAATMERFSMTDAARQTVTDKLVIGPVEIQSPNAQ